MLPSRRMPRRASIACEQEEDLAPCHAMPCTAKRGGRELPDLCNLHIVAQRSMAASCSAWLHTCMHAPHPCHLRGAAGADLEFVPAANPGLDGGVLVEALVSLVAEELKVRRAEALPPHSTCLAAPCNAVPCHAMRGAPLSACTDSVTEHGAERLISSQATCSFHAPRASACFAQRKPGWRVRRIRSLPDAEALLPDAEALLPDARCMWPSSVRAAAGMLWHQAGPAGARL